MSPLLVSSLTLNSAGAFASCAGSSRARARRTRIWGSVPRLGMARRFFRRLESCNDPRSGGAQERIDRGAGMNYRAFVLFVGLLAGTGLPQDTVKSGKHPIPKA